MIWVLYKFINNAKKNQWNRTNISMRVNLLNNHYFVVVVNIKCYWCKIIVINKIDRLQHYRCDCKFIKLNIS